MCSLDPTEDLFRRNCILSTFRSQASDRAGLFESRLRNTNPRLKVDVGSNFTGLNVFEFLIFSEV